MSSSRGDSKYEDLVKMRAENSWKDEDFLSLDIENEKIYNNDESENDQESNIAYDSMASDMDESTASLTKKTESVQGIPPWIERGTRKHDSNQIHPLTALHNEIVSFCHLMEPLPSEIEQREKLVLRIRDTVAKHFDKDTRLEVFGSQATGLFLPTSDIDIVVTTQDEETQNDKSNDIGDFKHNSESSYEHKVEISPLSRFARAIQEDWLDELSYFEVIENTRVPLVKFRHAPTNIQVDVCFNQASGPPAAQLTKRYLEALPPLRPLTFVMKYFLAARGLNEPYSGGVGSFMLQLLIVAFLQHRERDAVNFQRPTLYNLGSLLLEFFELYGVEFNYLTTGISLRNDGFFFPKGASDRKAVFWQELRPHMVALENPLDTTHDVGSSSFKFQTVQRAFSVAYKVLLCYTAAPILEQVPSILATILPPTDYMSSRLILKRRDQALQSSRRSDPGNRNSKRQRVR